MKKIGGNQRNENKSPTRKHTERNTQTKPAQTKTHNETTQQYAFTAINRTRNGRAEAKIDHRYDQPENSGPDSGPNSDTRSHVPSTNAPTECPHNQNKHNSHVPQGMERQHAKNSEQQRALMVAGQGKMAAHQKTMQKKAPKTALDNQPFENNIQKMKRQTTRKPVKLKNILAPQL